MTSNRTFSAPSFLGRRPGSRAQMMNVHRNISPENVASEFKSLQEKGLFTDTHIICGDGARRNVHGIVLATCSSFMRTWMETTFLQTHQHVIVLPDVASSELDSLIRVLYGVDPVVPPDLAAKVSVLAAALGITVDLPFWDNQERERREIQEESESVFDEDVEISHLTLPSPGTKANLPMVCWYCDDTFGSLAELQKHLSVHQDEHVKKKNRKCPRCRQIFSSMWSYRQHLLSHQRSEIHVLSPTDHGYAEPTLTSAVSTLERSSSPLNISASAVISNSAKPLPSSGPKKRQSAKSGKKSTEQPPLRARSDHSYGTRKREKSHVLEKHRTDHPYSARLQILKRKSESEGLVPERTDHVYTTPTLLQQQPAPAQPHLTSLDTNVAPKKVSKPRPSPSVSGSTRSRSSPASVVAAESRKPRSGHVKARAGQRLFPCEREQCDQAFTQLYRLNRHIREVHEKERLHTCRFCSKSFFKVTSKTRHEWTHTEHEMWKCPDCSKSFRDQSGMAYHRRKNVCQKTNRTH